MQDSFMSISYQCSDHNRWDRITEYNQQRFLRRLNPVRARSAQYFKIYCENHKNTTPLMMLTSFRR